MQIACIIIICLLPVNRMIYLDDRNRDLVIVCGIPYLIIVCILLITTLMGEDTTIMQIVLLGVGAILNLTATVLALYSYCINAKERNLALYFMMLALAVNGGAMMDDVGLSFKKLRNNE